MASRSFQEPLNTGSFVTGAGPIPASVGIGLRLPHHQWVLENAPAAAWLEVHPENYMDNANAAAELELIRRDYPLSLHAVGLSLGSSEGISREHLRRLGRLIGRYEPGLVSDHLSWSAVGGVHLPDLLPLPYTEEALEVVAANIDVVQREIRCRLLVENPSSYVQLANSTLTEAEFLGQLIRRCGCAALLDVNNIAVSAHNHGEDSFDVLQSFLRHIPIASIAEIHLAGHATLSAEAGASLWVDDHGSPVSSEVWRLYESLIHAIGMRPTLIEWDTNLPKFDALRVEAETAGEISRMAVERGARRVAAG